MAESDTYFKYSIPIEEEDGVEKPAYDIPTGDTVKDVHYKDQVVVVEANDSMPHFHKDDVPVEVEELEQEVVEESSDNEHDQEEDVESGDGEVDSDDGDEEND